MSITFTLSRAGLKFSRNRESEGEETTISNADLSKGRPDVASLEQFASKVRHFRRREDRARDNTHTNTTANTAQNTESETSHATVHSDNLPNSRARPKFRLITASGLEKYTANTSNKPYVDNVAATDVNAHNELSSAIRPSQGAFHPVCNIQPQGGVDVGGSSTNTKDNVKKDDVTALKAAQPTLTQAPTPPSGTSSIQSKGKAPARPPDSKTAQIYIPRSRLDRWRKIRVANSETTKVEDVEFSPTNRGKLRNFSQVLSSKRDQIELFGKELPLCRASLVQVTESSAGPVAYICVQGLRNATDITRFHTAMSHKRYRPLYDPLKLCYDTSDLSHVGHFEGSTSHSFQHEPSKTGSNILDRTPEPGEMVDIVQAFYQYRPVAENKTYCGALSRASIHGHSWISTLGGVVEVDGRTFVISCQHDIVALSMASGSSLADTIVEGDIPSDVEGPLVFSSRDIPDGFDAINSLNSGSGSDRPSSLSSLQTVDFLGSSESETKAEWKDLSTAGPIRKIGEWSLIPVGNCSILPNFVKRTKKSKGKDIGSPDIHYIEEISEPCAGCTGYIASDSGGEFSGIISANTGFMVGGGTKGLVEVWSIHFDNQERLQKGGSGSWVLDTTNPLRYKAVGAAIAASDGVVHFVQLSDQFREITKVLSRESPISLPPTFRTLVHCAHLSFKANYSSSDWFLDQALSPDALRQMFDGWYLPAIKVLLGVDDDNVMPTTSTSLPEARTMQALRSLLLLYGEDLLDNIICGEEWLNRHTSELSSSEIYALKELFAAARPFRDSELSQRKRKPLFPRGGEERDGVHSDENVAPNENQRRNGTGVSSSGDLPQETQSRGAVSLLFTKNSPGLTPIFLLWVFPMIAFSTLTGMVAAGTLIAVENNMYTPLQLGVGRVISLGAVSGIIATTVWSLQLGLIYFERRYKCALYIGGRPIPLRNTVKVMAFTILILVSSFMRTALPALYVARSLDLEDTHSVVVSSLAATAPMLLSTTSPVLIWYVGWEYQRSRSRERSTKWAVSAAVSWWLVTIGFDSLAGYAFARVAQNQGIGYIHPTSSATSVGVFGALTILWPVLSLIPFGSCIFPIILLHRRHMIIRFSSDNGAEQVRDSALPQIGGGSSNYQQSSGPPQRNSLV